jgi:hypothetical protein
VTGKAARGVRSSERVINRVGHIQQIRILNNGVRAGSYWCHQRLTRRITATRSRAVSPSNNVGSWSAIRTAY